jgi:GNAT superfamily N-acetyltransferase
VIGLVLESVPFMSLACDRHFTPLLAEYAAESAIEGLPPPTARLETYRRLEKAGILHTIWARFNGQLIGFLVILVQELTHYDVPLAVGESFFVGKEWRSTGAGLRLLRAAEAKSRELKAAGLLLSAPLNGVLAEVLSRLDYTETNRVFFKKLQPKADAALPAMLPEAIDKVRQLEAAAREMPQVPLRVDHILHAGVYSRTLQMDAGMMITGALIKIPTVVAVAGDALAYVGTDKPIRCTGYTLFEAAAGRKQVFIAMGDTAITMTFATKATTVEEAEREFTDEFDLLTTRSA